MTRATIDAETWMGPWLATCASHPRIVMTGEKGFEAAYGMAEQAYSAEGVPARDMRHLRVRPVSAARAADLRANAREATVIAHYRRLDAIMAEHAARAA